MAQIIPSILTDSVSVAQSQLDRLAGLVDWIQIDLMDGHFVSERSISAEEAARLQSPVSLEAHLMVAEPSRWWRGLPRDRYKRVYIHIEPLLEPADEIRALRDAGFIVGLANNLETPISAFEEYADMVDNILFMSVSPGRQGQPFNSAVLDKIRECVNQFPDIQIAIDGGVTEAQIEDIVRAGVDDIGIGSLISQAADPVPILNNLRELLT